LEIRYQQGVCWIFTVTELIPPGIVAAKSRANRVLDELAPAFSSKSAQNMRHPVVDGLHSIDFAVDRRAAFLLTLKMKGVKTNSFFDSF
jgi:hypothetical protein